MPMDDFEIALVARLRARDEDAFADAVSAYSGKVYGLVLRLVNDHGEAQDIAQEVFVTLWKSIDSFRGESRFSTWLLRIAANHAKNRIKYLSRRPTDRGDLAAASEEVLADRHHTPAHGHLPAPDVVMESSQTGAIVARAIATLDEDHRLLVVLRDIEEMSYEEICEITNLPEGTVKSRLHRARMELKDLLAKDFATKDEEP